MSKVHKILQGQSLKRKSDERLLELNSDRITQTLNGSVGNELMSEYAFVKLPTIILPEFTGSYVDWIVTLNN